jgi:hypothetical protein
MGNTVPRKMRCQGRGRLAGRTRLFGDCVRTDWIRFGVNLLVSLATSRVLEGKLGYDQLVILVVARHGLAR